MPIRIHKIKKIIDELKNDRIYVSDLDGHEIASWFKSNLKSVPHNKANMIVCYATQEHLKGLGINYKDTTGTNSVIQAFVNRSNPSEIYKIRMIAFSDMSDKLKSKLDECNGFIVVDE